MPSRGEGVCAPGGRSISADVVEQGLVAGASRVGVHDQGLVNGPSNVLTLPRVNAQRRAERLGSLQKDTERRA
jgi:hypothetical protein